MSYKFVKYKVSKIIKLSYMDYKFTSRTNCIDNSFFNHIKSYEMYLLLQNDKSNGMKFISQSHSYLRNT